MMRLAVGEKVLDMFSRFDTENDCERQTDGQLFVLLIDRIIVAYRPSALA